MVNNKIPIHRYNFLLKLLINIFIRVFYFPPTFKHKAYGLLRPLPVEQLTFHHQKEIGQVLTKCGGDPYVGEQTVSIPGKTAVLLLTAITVKR